MYIHFKTFIIGLGTHRDLGREVGEMEVSFRVPKWTVLGLREGTRDGNDKWKLAYWWAALSVMGLSGLRRVDQSKDVLWLTTFIIGDEISF